MSAVTQDQATVVRELFDDISDDERAELDADLDGWRDDLVDLVASIQTQRAARTADLERFRLDCITGVDGLSMADFHEERVSHEEWKARAGAISTRANARLSKLNRRIRQRNVEQNGDKERRVVQALVDAIKLHRESTEVDFDPTDADLELWAVLEQRTTGQLDGGVA